MRKPTEHKHHVHFSFEKLKLFKDLRDEETATAKTAKHMIGVVLCTCPVLVGTYNRHTEYELIDSSQYELIVSTCISISSVYLADTAPTT